MRGKRKRPRLALASTACCARASRYVGILNGIDTVVWDPSTDAYLPAHFDASHREGKLACKSALLEAFGMPQGDEALERPLVGIVSRLVDQKGFDLIAEAADGLLELDASWVVIGSGDARYETMWRAIADRYPARVGVSIGFNERFAHLIEAGADVFLMPSNFEPCGLNQMYSLRYGTLPVVRAVGGLDDTVREYVARASRKWLQVRGGFRRGPVADAPAGAANLSRSGRVGRDRPAGHGRRSLLGRVGSGVCQSV